jgi:hypothetical protein
MNKHRKIDKHFKIMVNKRSVKILKYRRECHYYENTNEEVCTIELITKIPNNVLDQSEVVIEIEGETKIKARWIMHFQQPGLHRYKYIISK